MYICRAIYFLDDRYTARPFMPKSELTDSDISWAIFFSAFLEGKDLNGHQRFQIGPAKSE